MWKYIKNWLISKFHVHEYETIHEEMINVWSEDKTKTSYPIEIYKSYIQKCKVCNHIRSYRIKL